MMDTISNWRHEYNRWGVGASVDSKEIRIIGLQPFGGAPPLTLTREHALELAAWIVAVCMPKEGEFERVLAHVRGEPLT